MWGRIVTFSRYKGLKKEKLTIKIPAHGTSQECSCCGHIHPDNRETQAIFTCQKCGLTLNADYNASLVIKKRGIKMLRNGEITAKDKKTVGFRKQKSDSQLGPGRSEVTCVETIVRRGVGNTRNMQAVDDTRSRHFNCHRQLSGGSSPLMQETGVMLEVLTVPRSMRFYIVRLKWHYNSETITFASRTVLLTSVREVFPETRRTIHSGS